LSEAPLPSRPHHYWQHGTAQKNDYNGTTLALWGSYGAQEREALLRYYERFAQEHAPGLKTEVQIYSNAEFMTKLTAALAGGTGPDFTRFKEYQAIDTAPRKSTLAVDGLLSKEKSLKATDFTPQCIEGSKYKDKLYGIPHHHQFVMLGWNKELFKQAGLNPDKAPETVDELRSHAKRLTDVPKEQWGFRQYEFGPPPREQIFNWFMEQWQSDPAIATVPVKKALLDKAPWSDPATGWRPIIDVVKMPGNRPKPHIPDWDEYTEKNIVPFLTEAWRQQKSPKDALAEANRQANAWLDARPKDR
jgi:ABC-type glycerol-3-phosphate transport system substrate-binding protein